MCDIFNWEDIDKNRTCDILVWELCSTHSIIPFEHLIYIIFQLLVQVKNWQQGGGRDMIFSRALLTLATCRCEVRWGQRASETYNYLVAPFYITLMLTPNISVLHKTTYIQKRTKLNWSLTAAETWKIRITGGNEWIVYLQKSTDEVFNIHEHKPNP